MNPVCGLMLLWQTASSEWQDLTRLLTPYCLEEVVLGKLEGSQGDSGASQDFGKGGGAMVKVRHEQKVLSSGQLCAQDIGWDPGLSQSCAVEVLARIPIQKTLCRPSTSLLRALPKSPQGQRDPWRRYGAIAPRPELLSSDDAPPSSLHSPLL